MDVLFNLGFVALDKLRGHLLFCTVITKLQGLLERQLNAHGFQ